MAVNGTSTSSAGGFNVPPSSNFNTQPTSPEVLRLSDYEALANGNSSDVLNRIISLGTDSFQFSEFRSATDAFGNGYFGDFNVPSGGQLTDVNIAPDLNFKNSLLDSRKAYLENIIRNLTTLSVGGLEQQLRRDRGLDPQTAREQAQVLFNRILANNERIIQAAQRVITQINNIQDGNRTQAQGATTRYQNLQTQLGTIISGFNGGGQGG